MKYLGSVKLYSDNVAASIVVSFHRQDDHYVINTNDDFYCTCETREQVNEEILDIKDYYHLSFVPKIFSLI